MCLSTIITIMVFSTERLLTVLCDTRYSYDVFSDAWFRDTHDALALYSFPHLLIHSSIHAFINSVTQSFIRLLLLLLRHLRIGWLMKTRKTLLLVASIWRKHLCSLTWTTSNTCILLFSKFRNSQHTIKWVKIKLFLCFTVRIFCDLNFHSFLFYAL